jgi:hypothetical protein
MISGWRDRARPWLLGLFMALGLGTALLSTPACNTDVSAQEGCHAICACTRFLPSEQQQCEVTCQTREQPLAQPCLRCVSEAESCTTLARDCSDVCPFEDLTTP